MLLHEVAEPVNRCEFGTFVDRVLVVGNEQTKDVEVVFFVCTQRVAVEQVIDDRDGPLVLVFITDWARRKLAE
jgi:hypothetical protein